MKKLMFLAMLFGAIIITANSVSAQSICSNKSDGRQVYVEIANLTNNAFSVNLVNENCEETPAAQEVPAMKIFSRILTNGQSFYIRKTGSGEILHQSFVNPAKPILFVETQTDGSKVSVRELDVVGDNDFKMRADAAFAAVNLSATAQTRVTFAKGASEKTISVTLPANGEKSFVLAVNKKQAINVNALTKQNLLEFSFSLVNAGESDNFEDYEGGLTVLTGRKGNYVFSVLNNSKKSRTFKMKVRVGAASEYEGGVTDN